ncbi:hypothetical protein OAK66_02690 [Candidatus Nitrosopelagicus sp.]|nr:hypothetical protein [Candidatus Nitrosopelagicus sp.]
MNTTQLSKKRVKIFHPFLVAIFPVVILYSQNIGRVQIEDVFFPLILLVGFSIGLFYLIKLILKNPYKSALIVTILLIFLFSYGHIYYLLTEISLDGFDLGRNRYLIPIFGLSLIAGIYFVIRAKRIFDNATSILNVISIVFILVAISNVGFVAAEITSCEDCAIQGLFYETTDFSKYFEPHDFSISQDQQLPNVYYLILDEYARHDALTEFHEFDNSEFINYLEEKGFHVAKESLANYPLSIMSIPAIMNMNYLNFLSDEMGSEVRNYQPMNEKNNGLYPNNMVMKNFKEMNYKIINFNTFALHAHDLPLADESVCHRTPFVLDNRLVDVIARTSIVGYFVERWAEAELRQVTVCALDKFSESGKLFSEPTFVWAHIMLPHPPWIFGPNGEEITPGNPLLITDNPEFRESGWEPRQQYIQQLQFANKKTIQLVDQILENDPFSIIIIQGDHGTAWGMDWENPSEKDVYQRLRNFDAIYFPDSDKRIQLKDDRTLVNTFRTIFNVYFGSNYDILENKLYWHTFEKPFSIDDVTNYVIKE